MAMIIRNGIEYAGGGSGGIEITQAEYNALGDKVKTDGVTYFIIDPDEEQSFAENCKVRYVDDPNDEDYDWLQVNHNGVWKRTRKVGFEVGTLFRPNSNNAEFVVNKTYGTLPYLNDTTLSVGNTLSFAPASTSVSSAQWGYSIISKKIDVTNFSKIYMKHKTTLPQISEATFAQIIVVSDLKTNPNATPLAKNIYLINSVQVREGTTELDVSFISGEVYILIEMRVNMSGYNSSTCNCIIEEMWME